MLRLFTFFLFLFLPRLLFSQNAEPIRLKNPQDLFLIGEKVDFLEDQGGKMQIEDILLPHNQEKFSPHTHPIFARPATTSAFWFRFAFQNHSSEDAWLEIGSAFVWYLDFYYPDSAQSYQKHETGTLRPSENRFYEVRNAFWLPLNRAKDTKTSVYYLRIRTEFPPEVPLQIGTLRSLHKNKDISDFLSAGFVGLMAIMLLYNAFLYFSTRDRIYLFYLPYLLCVLIHTPFLGGYSFFSGTWAYEYYLIWGNLPNIFGILFCIYYLQLQKHSPFFYRLSLVFLAVLLLQGLLFGLGIRMVYLITIYQLTVMGSTLTSLAAGYYLAWKHKKKAVFYIVGWTFAIGSILIFIAVINGFLPFNAFSRNILYFGLGLEVGMFSIALGYRMNILKALNLRLIKNQNSALEQKVEQRTQELYKTMKALAFQRDNIVTSIHYALRIQRAIMPTENDLKKYFDCFVVFRPKNIVSGDFYWFAEKVVSEQGAVISEQPALPTPDHLPLTTKKYILAVADCTGHGVSGAFMTMIGNNILNQIVHDYEIHPPDQILNLMTALLDKTLSRSERKIRDGMDIAILVFYVPSAQPYPSKIEYAGAKLPLYYSQNGEIREIKADRVAIGGLPREGFYYQKHELVLGEMANRMRLPSTLYLCSDGFQDQFHSQTKQKFLSPNFRKLLLEIAEKPIAEQKQIIEQTFEEWKGKREQTDDVTVLGIRIEPRS